MSDLSSPIFRETNEMRFKGLQDVMSTANAVLWVSTRAKSGINRDANMSLGLSDTLLAERLSLRPQSIDVDNPSSFDSGLLAQLLLRLTLSHPFESDRQLWSHEPDLVFKGGALYIPRASSLQDMNHRSAVRTRQITQIHEPDLVFKDGALYIPRVSSLQDMNHRSAVRTRQITQITAVKSRDMSVILDDGQDALVVQLLPDLDVQEDEILLRTSVSSIRSISYNSHEAAAEQQVEHESPKTQTAGYISVIVQLDTAEDPADCMNKLVTCFAQALGNMLEINPEALDSSMPVSSLGIDSLVAIRIREWFLRETGVDMPVLKVMSDNYSMSRLCDDVLVDWRKLNKV